MSNSTQIAYCGLYCGNCIIRREHIGERSANLLDAIQTDEFRKLSEGLPKIAPDLFAAIAKIERCRPVLEALSHLKCLRSCKEGGGSNACKIRKCCRKKKLVGCWKCGSFETCQILEWLKPVHGDAHLRNLRKLKNCGVTQFLSGSKHW